MAAKATSVKLGQNSKVGVRAAAGPRQPEVRQVTERDDQRRRRQGQQRRPVFRLAQDSSGESPVKLTIT